VKSVVVVVGAFVVVGRGEVVVVVGAVVAGGAGFDVDVVEAVLAPNVDFAESDFDGSQLATRPIDARTNATSTYFFMGFGLCPPIRVMTDSSEFSPFMTEIVACPSSLGVIRTGSLVNMGQTAGPRTARLPPVLAWRVGMLRRSELRQRDPGWLRARQMGQEAGGAGEGSRRRCAPPPDSREPLRRDNGPLAGPVASMERVKGIEPS
jgi:hypothetical protein